MDYFRPHLSKDYTSSSSPTTAPVQQAQLAEAQGEIEAGQMVSVQTVISTTVGTDMEKGAKSRRFSFWSFSFYKKRATVAPREPGNIPQDTRKEKQSVKESQTQPIASSGLSRSEKRAKKSALAVRSLIVGPSGIDSPKANSALARPKLERIKAQLIQPKTANKVITALRQLPASDDPDLTLAQSTNGPIHAVCLEHTEAEEEVLHFSKLVAKDPRLPTAPNVLSSPVDRLAAVFDDMHVIDLVKSPDLGLGQPASGKGLLAGALPTPETVLNGVKQITPELMALGYAAGQTIAADHTGIHPPVDRMSVLTYWWGLELLLPPPSIEYLSNVQSVTGTVLNFLSALAMVNNGVREILPFIRYISQFVEFEFNAIRKQDKGQGVVCAATWIMPAAMIPRPWDFPLPPSEDSKEGKSSDKSDSSVEGAGGGVQLSPLPALSTKGELKATEVESPKPI